MSPEDVALYLADPQFAASLGADPPRCMNCQGIIKNPPPEWDGEQPLRHLIPIACEWERDGTHRATLQRTDR